MADEVTLENREIMNAMMALDALGQPGMKIPNVVGYKMVTMRRKLLPLAEAYEDARSALIREHRQMDADGKVLWQNPNEPDFSKRVYAFKDEDAWKAAIRALDRTPVPVNIDRFVASELGDVPPALMYALGPLLV